MGVAGRFGGLLVRGLRAERPQRGALLSPCPFARGKREGGFPPSWDPRGWSGTGGFTVVRQLSLRHRAEGRPGGRAAVRAAVSAPEGERAPFRPSCSAAPGGAGTKRRPAALGAGLGPGSPLGMRLLGWARAGRKERGATFSKQHFDVLNWKHEQQTRQPYLKKINRLLKKNSWL